MRSIFTPTVLEVIPKWVKRGATPKHIAAAVGCKVGSLRNACRKHRISLQRPAGAVLREPLPRINRPKHKPPKSRVVLYLSAAALERFKQSAQKRSQVRSHIAEILETVAKDDLFVAILGD